MLTMLFLKWVRNSSRNVVCKWKQPQGLKHFVWLNHLLGRMHLDFLYKLNFHLNIYNSHLALLLIQARSCPELILISQETKTTSKAQKLQWIMRVPIWKLAHSSILSWWKLNVLLLNTRKKMNKLRRLLKYLKVWMKYLHSTYICTNWVILMVLSSSVCFARYLLYLSFNLYTFLSLFNGGWVVLDILC